VPAEAAAKAAVAAHADIQQFFVSHRRRRAAAASRAQLPEDLAVRGIVRAYLLAAEDHQLSPLLVLPDDGGTPARFVAPRYSPKLIACLLVEGDEERILLVIALHEETLMIKYGRAAGAPASRHRVRAQVLLPDELAGEVEAEHAGHAEVGVDPFPVGDRRFRGIGVARMGSDAGFASVRRVWPGPLAAGSVEAEDFPGVDRVGRWAAPPPANPARWAAGLAAARALSLAPFHVRAVGPSARAPAEP